MLAHCHEAENQSSTIVKPCLPGVRSIDRELHLGHEGADNLVGKWEENKTGCIQLRAKFDDATHSSEAFGEGRYQVSKSGRSKLWEEEQPQLPSKDERNWTPDGRWNTCVQFLLSEDPLQPQHIFSLLVFGVFSPHKSTKTMATGKTTIPTPKNAGNWDSEHEKMDLGNLRSWGLLQQMICFTQNVGNVWKPEWSGMHC